jgi:eukaryotic-like serine/threonine-protein kinase
MQLWTDYEGVTIDGAFSLQKLLLPEGRSAFFSTSGPKGEPTVARLIECHFDEEEILARWRCVEALNHPNFLRFEHYGQIELDGSPVVYAVFEKVDANLAEVLAQGHLTVKDVAQLASSLVAALDVLHTHGFIHEHIEPRNIFAVGEVVKLRSDCIREAPEGEEGRAAKQRDVRDLATVLLQALTQRRSLEGILDSAVPPPFGQIIRNGLDGTWGLDEIRAALGKQFVETPRTAPKPVHTAPATPAAPAKPDVPAAPHVPPVLSDFDQKAPTGAARPSTRAETQLSLPLADQSRKAEYAGASTRTDGWGEEQSFSLRWLGAAGIFAVLLVLSAWVLARAWNGHKAAQAAAAVSQSAAQSAKQISASSALKPGAASLQRGGVLSQVGSRADWRVIAFTYNRRADAEKKVSSLTRSHPDLRPAVFTPSGRAPYLVSIGGVMERDAAYALARRSRSMGLPHDTYAQNYSR